MASRLVNVRLDEGRVRKARHLRERGIALSDVVREAIDERFAACGPRRTARDVRAVIARIFEQHPDPPNLPPRSYSVSNRKQARAAIVRRLQRRRR